MNVGALVNKKSSVTWCVVGVISIRAGVDIATSVAWNTGELYGIGKLFIRCGLVVMTVVANMCSSVGGAGWQLVLAV